MQPNITRLSRGLYRIDISLSACRQVVRWFTGNERAAQRYARTLAAQVAGGSVNA